jgi:hypothetical protein
MIWFKWGINSNQTHLLYSEYVVTFSYSRSGSSSDPLYNMYPYIVHNRQDGKGQIYTCHLRSISIRVLNVYTCTHMYTYTKIKEKKEKRRKERRRRGKKTFLEILNIFATLIVVIVSWVYPTSKLIKLYTLNCTHKYMWFSNINYTSIKL